MVSSSRKRLRVTTTEHGRVAERSNASERGRVAERSNVAERNNASERGRVAERSNAAERNNASERGRVAERSNAAERSQGITRQLLDWYDAHRRRLPWRELASPYATWISEVMLQQTQVAAVIPYFERWMKRFPSVIELADADPDSVMATWQGLGYYSRARNLQLSAQRVRDAHGGHLPADIELLRKLPGIGRYTAGAIASIAFEQPEPAVDGNVMRVLTRVEALRGDPRSEPLSSRLWEIAGTLVRCESPSRFNQALMELGALVCVPEKPRCGQCPLVGQCRARQLGIVEDLPEIPRRPKPLVRRSVVIVSRNRTGWLVSKQPTDGEHWAGLYLFPTTELRTDETPIAAAQRLLSSLDPAASIAAEPPVATFRYPITRFRFEAVAYCAPALNSKTVARRHARYVTAAELRTLAMPAPHRRLFERLANQPHGPTATSAGPRVRGPVD